jgi:hypothetical protein
MMDRLDTVIQRLYDGSSTPAENAEVLHLIHDMRTERDDLRRRVEEARGLVAPTLVEATYEIDHHKNPGCPIATARRLVMLDAVLSGEKSFDLR